MLRICDCMFTIVSVTQAPANGVICIKIYTIDLILGVPFQVWCIKTVILYYRHSCYIETLRITFLTKSLGKDKFPKLSIFIPTHNLYHNIPDIVHKHIWFFKCWQSIWSESDMSYTVKNITVQESIVTLLVISMIWLDIKSRQKFTT